MLKSVTYLNNLIWVVKLLRADINKISPIWLIIHTVTRLTDRQYTFPPGMPWFLETEGVLSVWKPEWAEIVFFEKSLEIHG